tara:strand:- start:148 stop:555 length:408 start_codon:yes stop_codon:yes gene_type:complete
MRTQAEPRLDVFCTENLVMTSSSFASKRSSRMFTPSVPTRNGPQCPECNEALDWPARDLPDDHILKCPNGHALCSMGDFRLAAREMALQEEFRLTRDGARSHGQHRVPERPVARMPNTASHGTSHESLAGSISAA